MTIMIVRCFVEHPTCSLLFGSALCSDSIPEHRAYNKTLLLCKSNSSHTVYTSMCNIATMLLHGNKTDHQPSCLIIRISHSSPVRNVAVSIITSYT